ncbi:hypothetical protein SAMN05421664_3284 [Chryseobacterium soldanellicola]|uniref:Microcystin-dependent protein n=1 Tax=Chryseobacterium soldanellicola TaxID=311333 RepID=A0A1H1FV53_9FLAO|nr:hypothetical protein [Chryseobacterium soldanellicola]SDR04847.1 hypothetical protein SAMN05421664_3284 [Chryseobacterium soldanellicola]
MKKNIYLSSIVFLSIVNITYGQIGVNISAPQSTLDIKAINSTGTFTNADGILVPRVDRQRAQNMASIETSTIIYINNSATGTQTGKAQNIDKTGFYYYSGSVWEKLFYTDKSSLIGNVKYSVKTTDHDGWYLLDGRAVSSFPATVQAKAQALGFTANIPNASDRVLKTKSAAESLAAIGGSNLLAISQSNLPNITLTSTTNGTTDASGAHAHGPAVGSAYLLSGTSAGNNGQGYGNAGSGAWGGVNWRANTAAAGAHTHTFSGTVNTPLGGAGESIDNRSPYLSVNTFIYLGE